MGILYIMGILDIIGIMALWHYGQKEFQMAGQALCAF